MEGWVPKTVGNGRFRIRNPVWRTSDHLVLAAWDTRLEMPRALKVLAPGARREQPARARLLNEAALLTFLHHPHILRAFDLVPDADLGAALVTQPLDAQPVDSLLAEGRMAPDLALQLIRDVLSALTQSHHQGVLHNAVDGEAVLVRHDGRGMLGNYGRGGHVQITSDRVQVDLRGVAALLFKMLAGHDGGDLLTASVNPHLPVWTSLPPAVAPVLRRALHPSLALQYRSAIEMLADLQTAFAHTPATAPPRRSQRR